MPTTPRIRTVLLALATLPVLLTACAANTTHPAAPPTTTAATEPRPDPCGTTITGILTGEGLTVTRDQPYQQLLNDPQLGFTGCEATSGDTTSFYLEATNMTIDYLRSSRLAAQYSLQAWTIAGHQAVLANSRQYPGQCMLLIRLPDYRLLLDGDFPNHSCDRAIEIADKIVPDLQGK